MPKATQVIVLPGDLCISKPSVALSFAISPDERDNCGLYIDVYVKSGCVKIWEGMPFSGLRVLQAAEQRS
jgi:hypothetical protein